MNFPRTLSYQGHMINLAGKGRAAGSTAYMDPSKGTNLDLFAGRVVQIGHVFSLVQIDGNRSMPAVRVDHSSLNGRSPVRVGDTMIVGPLKFESQGPCAQAAWTRDKPQPVRNSHRNPHGNGRSTRRQGVIGQIAPSGTFGWIIDQQGNLIFVHVAQLTSAPFRVGQKVHFLVGDEGRGPKAFDVRAA